VAELVSQLQANDFEVVVVSSCEAPGPLVFPELPAPDRLTVVRKPNLGYDFGSWSIGLAAVPEILGADRVLLLNDSMAGPFAPLGPLLGEFSATRADVWGLTDTYQFGYHLQSYCLGFAGGMLAERPLRRFWAHIRHETDKDQIIHRNEIGLSVLLRQEGYSLAPAFPHETVVGSGENPVIIGWRTLLLQGFPFLKREIIRDPDVAPGGQLAPQVVRELFGAELTDWVEDRAS